MVSYQHVLKTSRSSGLDKHGGWSRKWSMLVHHPIIMTELCNRSCTWGNATIQKCHFSKKAGVAPVYFWHQIPLQMRRCGDRWGHQFMPVPHLKYWAFQSWFQGQDYQSEKLIHCQQPIAASGGEYLSLLLGQFQEYLIYPLSWMKFLIFQHLWCWKISLKDF